MDRLTTAMRSPVVDMLRTVVFVLFVTRYGWKLYALLRLLGVGGVVRLAIKQVLAKGIQALRAAVPAADAKVQAEIRKSVATMEKSMLVKVPGVSGRRRLPEVGLDAEAVHLELQKYRGLGGAAVERGRVSGAVYNADAAVQELAVKAYSLFATANPLHPDIFPGVRQMEAEVVAMTLAMFNAPPKAVGSVTSGGTESILLAVLACRESARATRGVVNPEMLVPTTAHAAFDKAAAYFNVAMRHIPVDTVSGMVDVAALERAISPNTVMIVGSAPNFPHGIIDPLPALSALALQHGIPFHVDCCLGGFLVPFMTAAGFPLPHACDFALPGVTSISADTHKYGFAPKGSSVVLYRSAALRSFQYYVTTEWPGGVYATPTMAGSRPGGLIAGCWSVMLNFGQSGYTESTRKIVAATRTCIKEISQIEELEVIGKPLISVLAFRFKAATKMNTFGLGDMLSQKGWNLNILQNPASIHIALTMCTVPVIREFITDIQKSVELLKKDPKLGEGTVAAIYGTAASVPDRSIINDVAKGFCDILTTVA